MDVAGRLPKLRVALAGTDAEFVLVTKLVNIRYLCGFTGSAGMLLVGPHDAVLVTDGRYREQAASELAAAGVADQVEVAIGLTAPEQYAILAGPTRGRRLGLESATVTWAQLRAMERTHLPEVASLVPLDGLVEGLRLVKDTGEVDRIEAAAGIATASLEAVLPLLDGQPTEGEIGLALDFELRRRGAAGNSFETIVGSGPNGAKPHHRASGSTRRIVEGDLVVFDFGALVDGYCSDMTRTVCVGTPTGVQRRMLDVVTEAQAAGVAVVRPGVDGRAVDEACRAVIRAAGWEDAFSHGTGHGVGLEIHEDPRVSWSVAATLAAGHVVTVEPGVYLPEHGGVRVEDTLVVTPEGCRPLTHATKETDPHSWPAPRPTT